MTTLSPDCRAALLARLKEAELAYHQLVMGGGIRVIKDQNGEQVEYTSANRQALYSYILQLRSLLGVGPCGSEAQPTRPLTFIF
ncbi:putative head-to-tail joining protein [Achromobacter phage AXY1]|nr:putative head-to-tail joining protein [Achromobacter phage AXY1]